MNAPRTWPNSSLSNSVSTTAEQLTVTKRRSRRGPVLWRARATSSLPVPVSPLMSAVRTCGARRRIMPKSSCMTGPRPIIPQNSRRRATSLSIVSRFRRRSISSRTPASICSSRPKSIGLLR
ncbi:MAG: hypothetical protein DMF84_05325 [Acidobacteria bacterium]|nr:MAG: hypothetical protein DMF84_05325 [Acidobacteriota bacterium]